MSLRVDRDRALGAYIGGGIGDAMGGPVESSHAARIKRLVGEIKGFLTYERPYYRGEVGNPGGAHHLQPGSATDDTLLRAELTRFFLRTKPPRTVDMLARDFIEHANRDYFWFPKLEPLDRIACGEVKAADAGWDAPQGGGAAWWVPIGIINAGDPSAAAAQTDELSRIWKAPFERNMLSTTQAAVAAGLVPGATVEAMMAAALDVAGPLATKLLERGLEIGRKAGNFDELVDRIYAQALMPENVKKGGFPESAGMVKELDAPMPPVHAGIEDSDEGYATNALAEQVPLAAAVFVFAKGRPEAIPQAVMLGRDCDSIAAIVGTWVGALNGESGLPAEWVETVCSVNLVEIDIRGLAEQLLALDG